ncbi:MAG: CoA transferase, partial [Dehalococcoidia bacterium]
GRLEHQDELEARLAEWTRDRDRFEVMHLLQRRAVPAGVCQTPADRVDTDPQLAATDYLVELDHSEIGRWPVQNLPFTMSETPSIVGQPSNRGAPCYGEDNDYVYQQLLGLTPDEQAALKEAGVI